MTVRFNEDAVGKALLRDQPAEGWHAVLITSAAPYESKNNTNIMVEAVCRILDDPEDANSMVGVPFRQYLTLPLDNEDAAEHVAPNFAFRTWPEWAAVLFPEECNRMPRSTKGVWSNGGGEEITEEEAQLLARDAATTAGKKAAEMWGEKGEGVAEAMTGKVLYGKILYKKTAPDMPSLSFLRLSPPDDEELSGKFLREKVAPERPERPFAKGSKAKKKH